MNLYKIHALLNSIVFLFLFPVGILIAILRYYIGPIWIKLHIAFQLSGLLLLIISTIVIITASSANRKKEEKSESKNRKLHKFLGPIIILLVFTQVFWAYYGRNLLSYNTWLYSHSILGLTILGLGWYQVYLGKNMNNLSS
jgi:hypothetical protein